MENINPLALAGVLIAVTGLVAPALVYLGISIGALRKSTEQAHNRVDRMEMMLAEEFRELRNDLKTAIATAWRNCPLAESKHKERTHE